MEKLWQILRRHKWAVILAVLVGIIIAFPQAYFRYDNKDVYKDVEMHLTRADEIFYLLRMKELRDGHSNSGNAYWIEGKELPYLRPYLLEKIANFSGQLFGLNLANTILLGRLFFPALIFLLIYALLYRVTKKRPLSLAAVLTILLSSDLTQPGIFFKFLLERQAGYGFLPFARIIVPQIQSVFFFGFLLFFWLFLEKKKMIFSIINGIILGFSFYTYPYTWTFIYAFLGCLALIFIWRKKWCEIKHILIISFIAALISIPYFLNLYSAMQHPLYQEIALRAGLVKTHAPQIGALILILFALFLLFFPRKKKEQYSFFLALALTPFIVLNQQIITGHSIMPAHYHWHFHRPIMIIIVIIIIFYWLEKLVKNKKWLHLLLVLIIIFNFYYAFSVQKNSYQYLEPAAISEQRYGPVFDWLNENAQKDKTVFTSRKLSNLILVYTSLNSSSALDAHYNLIADEEQLWQRMFLYYRLDGLKSEDAAKQFFENKLYISAHIYGEYYREGWGGRENIPNEKINAIISAYQNSFDMPIENILRKYQTKYIIWDIQENPSWQLSQYSFLQEVHQSQGIKIYEIKQ